MALMLKECVRRNGDNLQELHPIKHLNIKDEQLTVLCAKMDTLSAKIATHIEQHLKGRDVNALCLRFKAKQDLELEMDSVRDEMSALENNQHIEQRLSGMKRVLRRLNMVENNVITLKGKIACEVTCGDELVMTELLFSNMLNEITSTENVSALLSCFVFDEPTKNNDRDQTLGDQRNADNFKKLKDKVLAIVEVQKDAKLEVNAKQYVESFSSGLMDVALQWSKGATFGEIMKITKVYEGSIIRVLKRLDELLSELISCSKLIGNGTLTERFEECKEKIRRDIVFSSSLYL